MRIQKMSLFACLMALANCGKAGKSEQKTAAPTCEDVAKNTHGLSLTRDEAVEFIKNCNADTKRFDAKVRACLAAAKELEDAQRCLGREPGDNRIGVADCTRVLERLIQRLEEGAGADGDKDIAAHVAAVTKRKDQCASDTFDGATANCLQHANTFSDALQCKSAAIGAAPTSATSPVADEAIADFKRAADDMCNCKDAACADKVKVDFEQTIAKYRHIKGTDAEMKALEPFAKMFAECSTAIGVRGNAPTGD